MRRTDQRSNLRPEPFRAGKALPLSFLGHAVFFSILMFFSGGPTDARPLIDPADVIEVSMVALPRPKAAVPQKEMRRATPPPKARVQPVPQAVASPDLAPVEAPQPEPDDREVREAMREELVRDMKREAVLESFRTLSEGPVDQNATNPTGEEDSQGSALATVGDAERARYGEEVRGVFYRGFSPLQDDPGLSATAWVWVDPQGKVLKHELKTSSNNGSFDAAVERAIRLVQTVPAPPEALVSGGPLRLDLVFAPGNQ